MRSLLYEIAAGPVGLAGTVLEYGFWRATVGVSDADLLRGTLACTGFGVYALALAAHPEARPQGSMAAVIFVVRPLERAATWVFRQERAFYMSRLLILILAIGYVCYTLVTSAPNVFGQSRQVQVQDNTRELATHGAAIESLEEWRRGMEAANISGRMMVLERNVAEMKDDQKYFARLLYGSLATGLIWLIQQAMALLRKGSKED